MMNRLLQSRPGRRRFLERGARSLALFLLGSRAGPVLAAEQSNAKPLFEALTGLGSLGKPDAKGLRLPPGFQSRVIARSMQPVLPGAAWRWHKAPDGGACFAHSDGGWVYVSNSEVKRINGGGGVGAVRFDAAGTIVDAYPILQRTDNNCAGGKTPWQTWLSCEEVERGFVHECDPFGLTTADTRRPALGRFKHEAVAIDPLRSHLYLTEDERDGGFYRFVPANALPDLSAGTLQVAEVGLRDGALRLTWHDVPDAFALSTPTRYQVAKATPFAGGEGIAWYEGTVYFTTKGDNRVWSYATGANRLEVLYDAYTTLSPHLSGVDNVTITASGDVLVAEDGGDMQIVLLTPAGLAIPVVQVIGQNDSEICGPAFDPSFQRLYFSSQTGPSDSDTDGITYEISRAWQG